MDPVRVSIIIPCYNSAEFVGETIGSVVRQDLPDLECIVVDDASTDGSADAAERELREEERPFRVVRGNKNAGANSARNLGARIARGRYLMFLDADDVLLPGAISTLMDMALRARSGMAVGGWDILVEEPGKGWQRARGNVPVSPSDPDGALRDWLTGARWSPPCALLWTREAFEAIGGWDTSVLLNQDGDLVMRALAAGVSIVGKQVPVALYRQHREQRASVSSGHLPEAKLLSGLGVIRHVEDILELQGRRAAFADALAAGYQKVAIRAFQCGHFDLGHDIVETARRLSSGVLVSPTLVGRLLERLIGLESKEHLAHRLGRFGLASAARRTHLSRLRRGASSNGAGPP